MIPAVSDLLERLRREPGRLWLGLALVAAIVLYAPTLGYDLVNLDDMWLVRDNPILHRLDANTLHTVMFDLDTNTRFLLGAEYLPVRDLSIAVDWAIWGDAYGGFHATSLLLYLVALIIWYRALVELGLSRTLVGLAIVLWAIHPTHAESVAWVSERKGLLALVFSGIVLLSYARIRRGGHLAWLAPALICTVAAVWSKAPAAFAIAALAPIELFAPAPRTSWRRSLSALGAIAVVGAAAFVPVLVVASRMQVVGGTSEPPAGYVAMVLGLHGQYTQLAAMMMPNSPSYPIVTVGPSWIQLVLGALSLLAALFAACAPARWWPTRPAAVRIGAWIWLLGWFPASRIVFSLKAVLAADRYILFASLGFALALAAGLLALRASPLRSALIAVVCLAAGIRTLDARGTWRDSDAMWTRASESNPYDGLAWSARAELADARGDTAGADKLVEEGLSHSRAPRLVMRGALVALSRGDRPAGIAGMREAAERGEVRAMANLASLLLQDGNIEEARRWARAAAIDSPLYVYGHRIRARIALQTGGMAEAAEALAAVHALEPADRGIACELALARAALGHRETAELGRCVFVPSHSRRAVAALAGAAH